MGNSQKEEILSKIYEMKNIIESYNYEKSKEIYQKIKLELVKIQSEDDIKEISNYLIDVHTEKRVGEEFRILIANLRLNDKLGYLFQLIYENELVESIDKDYKQDDSNIIKKVKIDKNNIEQVKQDLNVKIKRINIVYKYIELLRFKSIIVEIIAEKYFNLGNIIYSNYGTNKNQTSNELQEVVNLFSECIKYYQKTGNQKVKLEEYDIALKKVLAHRNILMGKELIQEEKYNEALKCLENVNTNNSFMIEEQKKGKYDCHKKLAEIEEEKKNYVKAIEYYMLIDNEYKIFELNIKINENYIIEHIKKKQYFETIQYFNQIFELVKNAQNREFIELKYTKIFQYLLIY